MIYNFSAGPACLPDSVLKIAGEAAVNFRNNGISLLEMSHRSTHVVELFNETSQNLRSLLKVPNNYKIIWLQGGASSQFSMVPLNLLPDNGHADYIETGSWSSKAIKECNKIGRASVIASSKESNFTFIPKNYVYNEGSKYLHITSNNTIYGTQFKQYPEGLDSDSFLVADMSSDILSKPIDINKFGLIYAGAQKNMGPAGVTLVIIRSDLLQQNYRVLPTMSDYSVHVDKKSMFNTPPVFSVYVVNETLKWLMNLGGVEAISDINIKKAESLFNAIDNSSIFESPVNYEDRSLMNVPFTFTNNDKDDKEFLEFCDKRGLKTLKGHRSVGGFRASIYNAMPQAGVKALIDAMKDFEKTY